MHRIDPVPHPLTDPTEERIAATIRAALDMVCDGARIEMDDDQRAEVSCTAARDIVRDLRCEEEMDDGEDHPDA
jgi:hypothetical protein